MISIIVCGFLTQLLRFVPQEASRRSNNWLPPGWAIIAMVVLGFNEFMTLLRYTPPQKKNQKKTYPMSLPSFDILLNIIILFQESSLSCRPLCWVFSEQSIVGATGYSQ